MTKEFEKWCSFENLGVSPDLNASHVKAAKAAWQASREQLKANLLSDEMVERVIKVISENLTPQDCSLMAVRACLERAAKTSLKAVVGEI